MSRRSAYKGRLSAVQRPLWYEVARWLVNLPRFVRIAMVFIFSLAVSFVVSPLVDNLYLSYMFTPETRLLPSLVSSGAGLINFFFGWWLVVGASGEVPPVRRGVIWYGLIGTVALLTVVALSIYGMTTATAPL